MAEAGDKLRASPYEPGVYFVGNQQWQVGGQACRCKRGRRRRNLDSCGRCLLVHAACVDKGCLRICMIPVRPSLLCIVVDQVGSRYTLVRVLGTGSFSCVCLAIDTQTNEKVGGHRVEEGEGG